MAKKTTKTRSDILLELKHEVLLLIVQRLLAAA
jgi:hypothetical protein